MEVISLLILPIGISPNSSIRRVSECLISLTDVVRIEPFSSINFSITTERGIFWCYRKALKTNPDLVAKVYFKLKISASGRVNSVSSKFKPKKYNDSEMATCMENKVKLWKFPANPDSEATNFKFSIALKAN